LRTTSKRSSSNAQMGSKAHFGKSWMIQPTWTISFSQVQKMVWLITIPLEEPITKEEVGKNALAELVKIHVGWWAEILICITQANPKWHNLRETMPAINQTLVQGQDSRDSVADENRAGDVIQIEKSEIAILRRHGHRLVWIC
jgi:hypothetical protein